MSVDWSYRKPQGPAESKEQVRARILNCPFEVELDVSAIRVPAEQLVDLYPGKLLVFNHSVDSPATLVVGDQPLYQAFVMRHNRKRVAGLNRAIPRPTGGKERS
jgi:flagellar motor switch protein FliM